MYLFAKNDIANFISTNGKIFHDQNPDDLGDGLFYNALYHSWRMWDMPADDTAKELFEMMERYHDEFGVLVRGMCDNFAVTEVCNGRYSNGGCLVASGNVGPGPLIMWCYALIQIHRHPVYGAKVKALASKCYNHLKKSNGYLLNPDKTRSKYGDLRNVWYQAPIRVLALLILARLAGSDDYYKIFKKHEWKLPYGDIKLPMTHTWYSEFIAFIAYDALISLEQIDVRKKVYLRGLRRMFVVTETYTNGMFYKIYTKYFGETAVSHAVDMWSLQTFSMTMRLRARTVNSNRKDIQKVTYNKTRVAAQALPVRERPNCNFMWNHNPFILDGSTNKKHSYLDFLMLYAYPKRNTYGVFPTNEEAC
jgi:hypothetical protein